MTDLDRVEEIVARMRELGVPEDALEPIRGWVRERRKPAEHSWPQGFWWAVLDWGLYLSMFVAFVCFGICIGAHQWVGSVLLGLVSLALLREDRVNMVRQRDLEDQVANRIAS